MRTDKLATSLLGQLAAACLVLGTCPAAGHASHFRGGTYNWSRADSTSQVVTFELQQVYRASYFNPVPAVGSTVTASAAVLRFGDGTQQSGISYTVQGYYPGVSVSIPGTDIIIVRATITHTYPAPGTFRAILTDGARDAYFLINNANTPVEHNIYVNTLPTGPIQSPRALLPPLVAIPAESPSQIAIPIAPGIGTAGDTVRAALDTLLRSGGPPYVLPPGLTLKKSGDQAVITFPPTSEVGNYCVSMTIMQNGAGSTLEGIITTRYVSQIGPAASLVAPLTTEPPLPVTHITAHPGVPLTITYDTDVPSPYTGFRYLHGAHPAGASFVPGASPHIMHFHWTPDSASAGRSYPLYVASEASIPDTDVVVGDDPPLYGDDRAHLIVDVVTPVLSAPGPDPARSMILEPCSPTPTRGMATISFSLPAAANISIEVIDLAGRRVRTVLPSVLRQAGRHAISWDGKDDNGTVTAPGVYLVRLASSSATASTRIVRLR